MVTNGEEIMSIVTKSDRVMSDLEMQNKFLFTKKYMRIILLPWKQMNPKFEFRCFIHQRILTAISQYEFQLVIPELQNEDILFKIRNTIVSFHNQISSSIPYPSCVMDLHLNCESEQNFKPELIEFNPFFGDLSSGSCLFEWQHDRDLLYNNVVIGEGTCLPVLRVRKEGDTCQFIEVYGT